MDKWEYKYAIGSPSVDELNHLGEQGWELAGIISNTGQVGSMPVTTSVTLIFKRRKS